jgi:hypothetical protein
MRVTPCCLVETRRRLGRTRFPHMQGRAESHVAWDLLHYSCGFSLDLVFNLEDGSNTVLRNIDGVTCFLSRSEVLIAMSIVVPALADM